MHRRIALLIFASLFAAQAEAGDKQSTAVEEPVFKPGSSWVFHVTSKDGEREHSVDAEWTLLWEDVKDGWSFAMQPLPKKISQGIATTPSGITNTSWRGWDAPGYAANGDTILSFPLEIGKTWKSEFESARGHMVCTHQVIDWENISVLAGSFRTVKLEQQCEARLDIETPESGSGKAAPNFQSKVTYWYAPEAQHFARELIEFVDRPDHFTNFELSSFHLTSQVQ
jgi:hypothetical protein